MKQQIFFISWECRMCTVQTFKKHPNLHWSNFQWMHSTSWTVCIICFYLKWTSLYVSKRREPHLNAKKKKVSKSILITNCYLINLFYYNYIKSNRMLCLLDSQSSIFMLMLLLYTQLVWCCKGHMQVSEHYSYEQEYLCVALYG